MRILFFGVVVSGFWCLTGYPAEFRRKVLALLEEGRSVASVAHDLEVSDRTICTWPLQDRIDRGLEEGLTSAEEAELPAAKQRILELETNRDRQAGRRRARGAGHPRRR